MKSHSGSSPSTKKNCMEGDEILLDLLGLKEWNGLVDSGKDRNR
jgi:hypothetical protein